MLPGTWRMSKYDMLAGYLWNFFPFLEQETVENYSGDASIPNIIAMSVQ